MNVLCNTAQKDLDTRDFACGVLRTRVEEECNDLGDRSDLVRGAEKTAAKIVRGDRVSKFGRGHSNWKLVRGAISSRPSSLADATRISKNSAE